MNCDWDPKKANRCQSTSLATKTYLMFNAARAVAQSPRSPLATRFVIVVCSGSFGGIVPGTSGSALTTTGTEKKVGAGELTTTFTLRTNESPRYRCQGRKRARPCLGSAAITRSAAYQPAGYIDGRTWPCIPNSRPFP